MASISGAAVGAWPAKNGMMASVMVFAASPPFHGFGRPQQAVNSAHDAQPKIITGRAGSVHLMAPFASEPGEVTSPDAGGRSWAGLKSSVSIRARVERAISPGVGSKVAHSISSNALTAKPSLERVSAWAARRARRSAIVTSPRLENRRCALRRPSPTTENPSGSLHPSPPLSVLPPQPEPGRQVRRRKRPPARGPSRHGVP